MPLDETRAAEIPDRETAGPSERSAQMVEDILHALSDRYRQVLELRFLKGYSIQETAQEMNVTPENCKVLQHRALAKAVELAGDRL